jgi:phage tail-like protein
MTAALPVALELQRPNFLWLNRDGRWLDFHWAGLELDEPDGKLVLARVPRGPDAAGEPVGDAALEGTAGVAVSPHGTVYFSDPLGHRVLRVGVCDGLPAAVDCFGGEGGGNTQFRFPRGLAWYPQRRALLVADSGNDRIQLFSEQSQQLLDVWRQVEGPTALAVDALGNVYVVESASARVQKLDARGRVVPGFWLRARQQQQLRAPFEVAVDARDERSDVFVLDSSAQRVFVFDREGVPRGAGIVLEIDAPQGIVVQGSSLYVGGRRRGAAGRGPCRLFKFARGRGSQGWALVGEALRCPPSVQALGVTPQAMLVVHRGAGLAPLELDPRAGHVRKGYLWGGPFANPSARSEPLHELQALVDELPKGTHLEFFVRSCPGDVPAKADEQPSWHDAPLAGASDSSRGKWVRLPSGNLQFAFRGAAAERIWVGVEFESDDGSVTPVLSQIKLSFDRETYLQYLPAIYREDSQTRQFLERFLLLFESSFSAVENEIGNLGSLFDAAATPAEFLPWLAGWLALGLDEAWQPDHQRAALASAFRLYGKRGTLDGLREALRFFGDIAAHIEEPLLQANWWALPDEASGANGSSSLGVSTMLVCAEAGGAVVGTTAVLDQSRLLSAEEIGLPLFDPLAHRFAVRIYRGAAFNDQTLSKVRAIVDRERPAHTDGHVCVIEPQLQLGMQARVGIDAIVASSEEVRTATADRNEQLVLGGQPRGRIGTESRIGQTSRL